MVFFVCFSCGESLKKNQVEKHWLTKCRDTHRVSCMDCSKDFWGKEYADHLKCITENEKYGGSQYVSKEMKGEKKQEAWIAHIKEKVANTHDMEPKLKELLNYITNFSNIPRKKKKFKNFLGNSAKVHNPYLVDEAWEVFEAASTNNNSNNKKGNGEEDQNDILKPAVDPSSITTHEQEDSQKPSLSKRERKEERQKKNKKKEKKDRIVESTTELNKPSKRKCEDDESDVEVKDSQKKRKKPKHEHVETVCEEQDRKSKKKKKKSVHEDKNGGLVMNENHLKNINSDNIDRLEGDMAQLLEKPEDGKNKKKKKKHSHEDENGLVVNGNHSQNMNGDHDPLEEGAVQLSSAFKWKTAIRRILQDAPEEGMKISKLQRKVLSLYYAARGESTHLKSEEEVMASLNKKLKMRDDKYVVCKNRVKLRSY